MFKLSAIPQPSYKMLSISLFPVIGLYQTKVTGGFIPSVEYFTQEKDDCIKKLDFIEHPLKQHKPYLC